MMSAPARSSAGARTKRMVNFIIRLLAQGHFVPLAVFFFPIVKRFAVDLVHGSVSDLHFARLPGQKKVDVVSFSIGSLHINTGEIFSVAKVLQPIIMDLY